MEMPVHRDNLLPRGRQVGKFIVIIHMGDYYRGQVEVWKQWIGPFYLFQEIPAGITNPEYAAFVEEVRESHDVLHYYLPCKCSIGKAFKKLEG